MKVLGIGTISQIGREVIHDLLEFGDFESIVSGKLIFSPNITLLNN